tara:strand:+ start:244 stop:381 length:138 start_codon:yes stop_codon:yes gene_type:complete
MEMLMDKIITILLFIGLFILASISISFIFLRHFFYSLMQVDKAKK